jgi:hypothetical protein
MEKNGTNRLMMSQSGHGTKLSFRKCCPKTC